jgi:hypothetical protein
MGIHERNCQFYRYSESSNFNVLVFNKTPFFFYVTRF